MISPVVELQPDHLSSKAQQYCDLGFVNFFPSKADGRNASAWVMTLGRATDWAAATADPEIEFLFPIPSAVDTSDELRDYLRATTYGDLTAPQKTNLQTIFDAHAILRSDFTAATTLAQIVQRVASTLFEKDHNFGMGSTF
jgi:hypothetical protein